MAVVAAGYRWHELYAPLGADNDHTSALLLRKARMTTGRITLATLLAVALAGPLGAPAPIARADPIDDRFLAALQAQGITYQSPEAAIAAGHLVCTELDHGETKNQVAQDVLNNSDLDPFHAGYFVGASIGAYCRYHSQNA
jgi:hypothetical protein